MCSLQLPRRVNCAALGLPRNVNICSLLALVRSPLAYDARRWPLALAAHQLSPPTPAVPNHGVQAGARRAGVGGGRAGVAGARRARVAGAGGGRHAGLGDGGGAGITDGAGLHHAGVAGARAGLGDGAGFLADGLFYMRLLSSHA